MSELERAITLMIAIQLGVLTAEQDGLADQELRDLLVILAKRNRAGADQENIARRARASAGIVAVDTKLHDPSILGSSFKDELEDEVLLTHGVSLLLPDRNQDL